MKRGLARVLRVRQLLEDLAGADLLVRSAELRRLEDAAEQHRRQAATVRIDALQQMLCGVVSGADTWLGMADAEILAWKSQRIGAMACEAKVEATAAHQQMMVRRMERRQVETLVAESAQAEQQDKNRREQHRLDDWFQSGASRPRPSE